MSWYVTPDGKRIETIWDKRLNVKGWFKDEHGKLHPVPHNCEFCGAWPATYGDPDGIHCTPCWVKKKSPA